MQPAVMTIGAARLLTRSGVRLAATQGRHGQQGSRRFDVVVLGATGFVGRLVAEEIACSYQASPAELRLG